MPSDLTLVDTNVLVYALYPEVEHHSASRSLLARAQAGEVTRGNTTTNSTNYTSKERRTTRALLNISDAPRLEPRAGWPARRPY
jgi:predicted nucleic acid-binding protein